MNWVCNCGIVNLHEDKECGQCGELRVDAWSESDRATVVAVRVLDVLARKTNHEPRGIFYDRCYQLPPRASFRNQVLASICHQPFLKN